MTTSARSKPLAIDVLVVDDHPQIGRLIVRALQPRASVVYAESYFHARELLERHRFRVVVADYLMPGPTGAALLAEVERSWPATRRVLMSAALDASLLSACPGAHRALDKSFPLSEIARIILEEVSLAP